ncbi:MAG: DUF3800 domain-containing protein [Pirellulales bacterium]
MTSTFNIYCDESCHLENDHQQVMVLGAVWAPLDAVADLAKKARAIKQAHGLAHDFELKSTKVSAGRLDYYQAVLEWFWAEPNLHFRALVVPDKQQLDHARFDQTHDDWYYKTYFGLLNTIIAPKHQYRVYIDIKDTRGRAKIAKLHQVLSNAQYDFTRTIIERVQLVRSHEVELLQLADLLIGIVSYANRGLASNAAKVALVNRLRALSGYCLTKTTLLREDKLNLFRWSPQAAP